MAKSKLKKQYKYIANKIKTTQKAVAAFGDKAKTIANDGLQHAKLILALAIESPTFTQKHGEQLVNEIGLSEFSSNGYKIYAPITQGDMSNPDSMERANAIKYEMYFAEYGAGLGASQAKSSAKGAVALNYVRTQTPRKDGSWTYPLITPELKVNDEGEIREYDYAITNTSEAVNYMYSARVLMSIEMQQAIADCEKAMNGKFKRISEQIRVSTSITRLK